MTQKRFRDLVASAGKPVVVTLWAEPQPSDPFTKAVKENRVLTIFRKHGGADTARPGFRKGAHVGYLVFPKSLPVTGDFKVIGIKYELIEQPVKAEQPWVKSSKVPKARKTQSVTKISEPLRLPPKPLPPTVPREKQFTVRIRRIATVENIVQVMARNKAEAVKKATDDVDARAFELEQASIKNMVRRVGE